jgi:hypothetical protein
MTPTRHDVAGFWLMILTAPPILHYFKNPSLPFLQKKMAINVQSSGRRQPKQLGSPAPPAHDHLNDWEALRHPRMTILTIGKPCAARA